MDFYRNSAYNYVFCMEKADEKGNERETQIMPDNT